MNRSILTYTGAGLYWALLFLIVGSPTQSQAEMKKHFFFASLPNTYLNSHIKESRMAFQMIMRKVFHRKHPEITLELDFLPDCRSILSPTNGRRYDVLITTSRDYFFLKDRIHLQPLAVLSKGDEPTEKLLLLTQRGTTWETLARKPKRNLLIDRGSRETLAKEWAAVLVADRQESTLDAFFPSIRLVDKPHRSVLPVFFGQSDVCIVSHIAYDLMLELNPQIETKLVILEQSPEFVDILICGTEQLDPLAGATVLEEATTMHNHPIGQQALTLIQMKRFWPFDPEKFKATEALYNKRHLDGAGE